MQAYVRGWLVRRHLDEVIFGWAAYDHAVRELKSFCEENSLTMHQLFDELDIDQNGTLVIEELQQFIIDHPALDLDQDEITALAYHLDNNHDHQIGIKEFVHSMLKHEKKLENIKARWNKHQNLKRKRASDYHIEQMRSNREHAEGIRNRSLAKNKELRLNLKQKSHFRELVRQHREEFEASKIRKQKRLLDGHLTYRQEAEIRHQNHFTIIRSAKSRALEALRLSNRLEHAGFAATNHSINTNSSEQSHFSDDHSDYYLKQQLDGTYCKERIPTSPKERRPQRKPSPRNSKNKKNPNQLTAVQRKAKFWKECIGDNGQMFYQNIVTKESAWVVPKNGVLYDPAMDMDDLWGTMATPDFQAIFNTLPSKTWNKRRSMEREGGRSPKKKEEWKSGEELAAISDDVLGISSLRFDEEKEKWLGGMD